MKQPSQENLLGYVLGALDAQEHEQVQQLIDQDPGLEEQLLEIKNSMLPLELIDEPNGPPVGLARRTCEFVANVEKLAQPETNTDSTTPNQNLIHPNIFTDINNSDSPVMSSRVEQANRWRSWSHSDFLTLIAAVAILAGVLFPALSYSRFNSQIVHCKKNLQTLGVAFMEYSNIQAQGTFIEIPNSDQTGVSGIYAPILKDSGLIEDTTVVCAGVRSDAPSVIPSFEQVDNAAGEQLLHFQKSMGGDYGYSLGYTKDNQYQAPRNLGRSYNVLLADVPSANLEGRRSANHRGFGQNVLFEDGHVDFIRGHVVGEDPIFENDLGLIGSGLHDGDNVIAASHLSPVIFEIRRLETPVDLLD